LHRTMVDSRYCLDPVVPERMSQVLKKHPTPGGVSLLGGSQSRTWRKRTPHEEQPYFFEKIGVVLEGGSSSSRFLIREPTNNLRSLFNLLFSVLKTKQPLENKRLKRLQRNKECESKGEPKSECEAQVIKGFTFNNLVVKDTRNANKNSLIYFSDCKG